MAKEMIQMCKHGIWASDQTSCSNCAPTPAPSGEAAREAAKNLCAKLFIAQEGWVLAAVMEALAAWGDRCRREQGIEAAAKICVAVETGDETLSRIRAALTPPAEPKESKPSRDVLPPRVGTYNPKEGI